MREDTSTLSDSSEADTSQSGLGRLARGHARALARSRTREVRMRELGFESYSEYLHSPDWHEVKVRYRASIREAQCQLCDSSLDLHLHHLTYDRVGEELVSDLMLLCGECHAAVHDLERLGTIGLDLTMKGASFADASMAIAEQRARAKQASLKRAAEYLQNDPVKQRLVGDQPPDSYIEPLPAAEHLLSNWDLG